MRDYSNFDQYYQELLGDIYSQPSSEGHTKDMAKIIREWLAPLGISNVLDVGYGQAESSIMFAGINVHFWSGVALGDDAKNETNNVWEMDFNFLEKIAIGYDLIFARHVLEHSPFPLITLMEWHRVSNRWLCLVLPNPRHYTFTGRNHYSVMDSQQAGWLIRRAGWKIKKFHMDDEEIWFLCEKAPRISYEGWAKAPISNSIYEFERDVLSQNGDVDVKEYFAKRERKDEVF